MKVTVELLEGFFIEVDELNHTLRQKGVKEQEDGTKKEVIKTIGYFSNVKACVERALRLICLGKNEDAVISLREYAERAESAFKRVEELELIPRINVDDEEFLRDE